ncbi:hypothetical protein [Sinorhizobium sp. BG8]|uniref:hypothetical protein n=1 Tax=Sinorhizobium sp. BG8 TaxID=2613773 RepID=UPI00193E0FB7|nr:hypothetical protein [Sinorhizobium sp. BG8]QRM56487.1 hypothetical protein F3Y30_19560 [Sinorhizobium sp. BG8]
MTTHFHERTMDQERRDQVLEIVASGCPAYPGSEIAYFVDMLTLTDAPAEPGKARSLFGAWSTLFPQRLAFRLT